MLVEDSQYRLLATFLIRLFGPDNLSIVFIISQF